MVAYVVDGHQMSISRACRVLSLPKSMYYYKKVKDDSETIAKLEELARIYPTEGQDLYYGEFARRVLGGTTNGYVVFICCLG